MDFQEFKADFQKEKVEEVKNQVPSKPVVSVCVQTYQHNKYIKRCLNSILEQKTNFDFEVLLGEDHSNDGTREICEDYAQRFPKKIRLFLHSRKNNIKVLGQASANFNVLYNLYSARGKYIAVCEGDDYWSDPLKLQKQYDFMFFNPEYSICYHDYKIINSQNHEIQSDKAFPLKQDLETNELLFPWCHPATLTVFFQNIFKNIPIETTLVINLDLFIYTLLGQIGPGKFLDQIKPAFYRVHQQGIWSEMRLESKILSKINTYQKISTFYTKSGKNETSYLFIKRKIKLKRYLIFLYLKKKQPIKAFHIFTQLLFFKLKIK
jgi:glycosyltransferase involved in cell wall biosynthesis